MFSEEEVKALYDEKVKLPQSYFDEHSMLPPVR